MTKGQIEMSPRLGDQAHIKPSQHVSHTSPIEDQVVEVYETARRLAQSKHFAVYVHNGPYGPRRGVAGPMVMKRLIKQLFPGYDDAGFETAYSIISQALRKTDAAVCIRRPIGAHKPGDDRDSPVWFIADTMPGNLVVVTLAQARKSADPQSRPSNFNENEFLTPRERRLPPEEVGEKLEPGEVTVSKKTPEDDQDQERRRSHLDQKQRDRAVKRILEEIQTNPVPMTVMELTQIVNAAENWSHNRTFYRDVASELLNSGDIVARIETKEEALMRGGGSLPKAKRPRLFWPAPGPVPIRKTLPKGIAPSKSAAEWRAAQEVQLTADAEAVLGYVTGQPNRDKRRLVHITTATGLDAHRARLALQRLINVGQITSSQGRYSLAGTRRRRSTNSSTTKRFISLPADPGMANVPTAPSGVVGVNDGDQEDLELVLNLAAKLGVQLPTGDESKFTELEERHRLTTERVHDLETENTKLREQVKALKAAIATLD